MLRSAVLSLLLTFLAACGETSSDESTTTTTTNFTTISSLLTASGCTTSCHNASAASSNGNFDGTSYTSTMNFVNTSSPSSSSLYKSAAQLDGVSLMPPTGSGSKMSQTNIDKILAWITAGASE